MMKEVSRCHFFGSINHPKVMLIHGMGFYWERCFENIIDTLKESCYLIVPEIIGHHNVIENTKIRVEDIVQTIESIMMENRIERIDVVYGISFGAILASELAFRHIIRFNNLILDGAQFVNMGILNRISSIIMAIQFKKIMKNKHMNSYIKSQMGYLNKNEIEILKPLMCENISFSSLVSSAYATYSYKISNKDFIDSNLIYIYGENEIFSQKSEQLLRQHCNKTFENNIFYNRGHAEVLSKLPNEITKIINKTLTQVPSIGVDFDEGFKIGKKV